MVDATVNNNSARLDPIALDVVGDANRGHHDVSRADNFPEVKNIITSSFGTLSDLSEISFKSLASSFGKTLPGFN